jgi:multiple sugar transport system substrate-binding protein
MRRQRTLYGLTVGLFLAALVAACTTPAVVPTATLQPTDVPATSAPAPTDAPQPTAAPATDLPATEVPPTEEPALDLSDQTVVFWHAMSSGANLEGMNALVEEFNSTNEWGITVEAVAQGNQAELETAFNGAVTTGELPNMTMGFPNGLALWHGLDVIRPLNEFIEGEHGLTVEQLEAIYPGPYASGTLADGTQVGIPMHQSAQVLFYNNSWAEELGFPNPPATSAELREQACAAANANATDDNPDNDGTGGLVYFPDASFVSPFVWAFDGEIINETGDGYSLNNPEVLQVAEFLKDLVDSGCTLTTPSFPNPEFAGRLALFAASSTAGIPFQVAAFEEAANDDTWSTIPFPGPNGTLAVDAFGQMIGIVRTNDDADLASWLFLRWLTSPESQAKWISTTGYFPSQTTTDVGTRATDDALWGGALELLALGRSEPNLPAHGAVRGQIRDAFFAILEASDTAGVQAILDTLNETAADTVAEIGSN